MQRVSRMCDIFNSGYPLKWAHTRAHAEESQKVHEKHRGDSGVWDLIFLRILVARRSQESAVLLPLTDTSPFMKQPPACAVLLVSFLLSR